MFKKSKKMHNPKISGEEAAKLVHDVLQKLTDADVPFVAMVALPTDEGVRQMSGMNGSIANLGPVLAHTLTKLVDGKDSGQMWGPAFLIAAQKSHLPIGVDASGMMDALMGKLLREGGPDDDSECDNPNCPTHGVKAKSADEPKVKRDGNVLEFPHTPTKH